MDDVSGVDRCLPAQRLRGGRILLVLLLRSPPIRGDGWWSVFRVPGRHRLRRLRLSAKDRPGRVSAALGRWNPRAPPGSFRRDRAPSPPERARTSGGHAWERAAVPGTPLWKDG